jgi:hypothetical protein
MGTKTLDFSAPGLAGAPPSRLIGTAQCSLDNASGIVIDIVRLARKSYLQSFLLS